MADNSLLIQVSAFSGLIGALATQGLTGLFAYIGDKRKSHLELKKTYRDKQVDIAENFYFVTGEKMAVIKKNVDYWKNYNSARSEESLDFLNREIIKLNTYMDKLDSENWKYNLVSLYFDVYMTSQLVISSNLRSKELYLKILDLRDAIKHTLEDSKSDLYQLYDEAIKELCLHYEQLSAQMASDMALVKAELTKEFRSG